MILPTWHPALRVIGVMLLSALIVFSRWPDTLLHANLWGEDGWVWYPGAYEDSWRCLLVPWTGYLQTVSRLVALAALPFPLAWVPTLFAGFAILAQATVAAFIVSDRLAPICRARWVRGTFALLYLLQPNSYEVYANLTNVQWHLGLLAFLVTLSAPPRRSSGWAFDIAVLTLSGLSGPLCLFIAPLALWRAALSRDRPSIARATVLCLGAATQLWCLFGPGVGRAVPNLGAGPRRLAQIVSLQIVLALLLGRHEMPLYMATGSWRNGLLPVAVATLATVLALCSFVRGPAVVRWSCVFGGLVLLAALVKPVASRVAPAWVQLATPDFGDRYFFLPALAWAVVLFGLSADPDVRLRWTSRTLLAIAFLSLPGDWHPPKTYPLRGRTDFVQKASAFANAPPGTVMEFPVHPAGTPPMRLRKRA